MLIHLQAALVVSAAFCCSDVGWLHNPSHLKLWHLGWSYVKDADIQENAHDAITLKFLPCSHIHSKSEAILQYLLWKTFSMTTSYNVTISFIIVFGKQE
ncbi:hypothetical protein AVEN_247337-1 [Araneus ventricosus]|uniref:Uncharacterized protein n=1 Tax=Araneus ventricosus TaxID=182803 RepID=A0A4Y2NYQ1_ARAVE|nr:hypothetical protein AVEN_247337-1 [Araneus ventricosus]